MRIVGASVVAAIVLAAWPARASSATELVASAKRAEAQKDDDVAARRYTDALALDATLIDAWLGLGALRDRQGDPREAERVYATCLERIPSSVPARLAHAEALHALGRIAEAVAEVDIVARVEPREKKRVAGWYAADGLYPAALAAWRAILVHATSEGDADATTEARAMIRALVLFAKPLDPAAYPASSSPVRATLGRLARSGS